MSKVILTWTPDVILTETKHKLKVNMGKAVRYAAKYCRKLISRGNLKGKRPSKAGEPPKKVKGILRASIASHVAKDGTRIRGYMGVTLSLADRYALALEFGTSGHTIKPTRAKLLAWKGKDGKLHFAKQVTIPPMAPRPFLRRSITDNQFALAHIIITGNPN